MSIDRVAPQSVEAEQSVLGSILIDPEAILKVADFLHGADFYRAQHADIYEAMLALHAQREPIDLVTLGDELTRHDRLEGRRAGVPGHLMNAVPTAVHVEHYGRIVEQKAVLRNLIAAAGKIAAVGYEEAHDTAAAIDRAESILFEISQRRTVAGFETLATSSARRTTGSSTSTSTAARSSASPPAWPGSTPCSAGSSPRTSSSSLRGPASGRRASPQRRAPCRHPRAEAGRHLLARDEPRAARAPPPVLGDGDQPPPPRPGSWRRPTGRRSPRS